MAGKEDKESYCLAQLVGVGDLFNLNLGVFLLLNEKPPNFLQGWISSFNEWK